MMENNRLLLAILLSAAILFGYQVLVPPPHPHRPVETTRATPSAEVPRAPDPLASPGNQPEAEPVPQNMPRLPIEAPRVHGSVNLIGARLDDLAMRDYHLTSDPHSPDWPLLIPRANSQPSTVQFGWTADDPKLRVPGANTPWTASGTLSPGHPATLSWDNGAGLLFRITFSIDDHYMFGVEQGVRNATGAPVSLHPWARVRRDYMPPTIGRAFLHEGPTGVIDGRLHELTYTETCKPGRAAEAEAGGARTAHPSNCAAVQPLGDHVALSEPTTGGWTGIADKYMLTALVPDQHASVTVAYRYLPDAAGDRFQVDTIRNAATVVPPGGEAAAVSHVFAGAMQIQLLDAYERQYGIPGLDKAIDFGRLYLLTKPILYALTWLNSMIGRFAVTLLCFTLIIKALMFPLTNYSFRSMQKMSLLGPRMTELRERYKDDPARMQQELGAIFKNEGVNPVSGCLPVLLQAPVFIALYNVIYIDIDIWHAPFVGWIRDMSEVDPTNLFNLFGLLPYDPTQLSQYLQLGAWPLILGGTMYLQQMFNPAPTDPAQARMFKFMPVLFTFFFARLPAGLVIYYSWSNILTVAQQWLMKRNTRLKPATARR